MFNELTGNFLESENNYIKNVSFQTVTPVQCSNVAVFLGSNFFSYLF